MLPSALPMNRTLPEITGEERMATPKLGLPSGLVSVARFLREPSVWRVQAGFLDARLMATSVPSCPARSRMLPAMEDELKKGQWNLMESMREPVCPSRRRKRAESEVAK
jgi:hypothetical protein